MNWQELEGRLDRVVASNFAERVRLTFFDGYKLDPKRPAIVIEAVLHFGGTDSYAAGEGFRVRLNSNEGELFLDRSTYDGPMPRAGDYVDCVSRPGEPQCEVREVSAAYSNVIALTIAR